MMDIDHPDYYNSCGIEVIKVIDAFALNFNLGNAIKYILRAGKKYGEPAEVTLKKAQWYLEHELERMKAINHEQSKF